MSNLGILALVGLILGIVALVAVLRRRRGNPYSSDAVQAHRRANDAPNPPPSTGESLVWGGQYVNERGMVVSYQRYEPACLHKKHKKRIVIEREPSVGVCAPVEDEGVARVRVRVVADDVHLGATGSAAPAATTEKTAATPTEPKGGGSKGGDTTETERLRREAEEAKKAVDDEVRRKAGAEKARDTAQARIKELERLLLEEKKRRPRDGGTPPKTAAETPPKEETKEEAPEAPVA